MDQMKIYKRKSLLEMLKMHSGNNKGSARACGMSVNAQYNETIIIGPLAQKIDK